MSLLPIIKRKLIVLADAYKASLKEAFKFFKECLGQKKVVIISDKRIISIPISSNIQTYLFSILLIFFLWVSYSTGQYFAHESVISQKEKEIWSSNMLNQNLQHQVLDLHDNLKELNSYFVNTQQLNQAQKNVDLLAPSSKKNKSSGSIAYSGDLFSEPNNSATPETETQRVLFNIRDKVIERIESLERIIGLTGIKLSKVISNNASLRDSVASIQRSSKFAQGGPFEPADNQNDNNVFDREEFMESVNYLRELEKAVHKMPLTYPMAEYYLSSGFGKRKDPFRNRWAMHKGLDFVGKINAEIYSTSPGIVKKAGRYGAYGKFIEIDHGNGFTTRYGHLNKIMVKKGQQVQRGELIGLQGNTGRSTGSHLHYEVRFNKRAYNPMKFLKAGQYVF